MSDFIRVENLLKIYNKNNETIRALDINELILPQQGVVLITGSSGAGKTTLLNMIGLLDGLTSGKISIAGEDISGIKDEEKTKLRGKNFGFVFQAFNLIPTLSVVENIALPLLPAKLDKEKIKEIDGLLERVGLSGRRKHLPSELSQGEQQRVAIVRSLVNNPKAILADEPISNLDPQNSKVILDLLLGFTQEEKLLLVIASNDIGLLQNRYNKEVHLETGRVI